MSMISIITPTYNRASLIPRMINSVLNQTYEDWELVIIDDGSADNTQEVVSGFNDSRIQYFKKENSGAPHSRNIGVAKAKGEYIIFLDSDDEVKPNWLFDLYNHLKVKNTSVACCGLEKHDYTGKLTEIRLPKDLGKMFNNFVGNFLSGTILMKREYFMEAGGYDIELSSGQHTELLMRLIPIFNQNEVKIANIFEPLIIVHLHKGERIRNNSEALYLGSTQFIKKHKQLLLDNPDKFSEYLSIAGVAAVRTKRYKNANSLFLQALKQNNGSVNSYVRLVISYLPILRDKFWNYNDPQ